MTTLATALLRVAELITRIRTGVSTAAGTTTTLVDSALTEPADFWNGGLLWFLTGALVGKTAQISDYALAGTTLTFPAQTQAPGAGSAYALANLEYPRAALVSAINTALVEMGSLPNEDTSLSTVADQEEYDLPAGVSDVRKVEIATATAAPYRYFEHRYWQEVPSGHLRIDPDYFPDSGYTIRLTYQAPHAAVALDADLISAYLPIEHLAYKAAVIAMRERIRVIGKDKPLLLEQYQELAALAERQASEHPIPYIPRRPRYASLPPDETLW